MQYSMNTVEYLYIIYCFLWFYTDDKKCDIQTTSNYFDLNMTFGAIYQLVKVNKEILGPTEHGKINTLSQ